jgi:hypothetical protein
VGRIPSIDNHPEINNVVAGTNVVSFQWTGAAASQFTVQWTAQLGSPWQTIATLPSSNGVSSFIDTNLARLNGLSGYYRVLSQ